jgi:cysteine desulfuration protein SufE
MASEDSIAHREQEIVDTFTLLGDWMEKYAYLIDLGKTLPLIEDEYKTDEYRVRGCQSQVWLRTESDDGLVHYRADSDALITKGLIGLLVKVLSGQPAREIVEARLEFLDRIGMREHLSPTRSNGLNAMVKQMKLQALAQTAERE